MSVVERPVLVEVEGQQVTDVQRDGSIHRCTVPRCQPVDGETYEGDRVDLDIGGREEGDGVARQHEAVDETGRLADVVGGLVQPVGDRVEGDVGPERVDELFPVHSS